jgi:AP2-associated kinase
MLDAEHRGPNTRREFDYILGLTITDSFQIYAGRGTSEARRNEPLPSPPTNAGSQSTVGAVFSPPVQQQQVLPEIAPMRRGRPTTTPHAPASKPNPSPIRGVTSDPFAALDGKAASSPPNDEVAARFPSLDQFSLLHDRGGKFEFDATSPTTATPKPKDLSQRVTERLADDAFAVPSQSRIAVPVSQQPSTGVSKAQQIISSTPALQSAVAPLHGPIYEPKPTKPSMVSTGTMTSESASPSDSLARNYTPSPIYRFPPASDHHRSASVPRNQPTSASSSQFRQDDRMPSNPNTALKNPSLLQPSHGRHASSSRPSLESGRPSSEAIEQITRTKSSNAQQQPSSTYVESSVDYLRERESVSKPGFLARQLSQPKPTEATTADSDFDEDGNIESNVEFLRTMEEQESARRKDRRRSTDNKQSKRSSLPSMNLTSTKLLAGKFGDAFKRFEHNTGSPAGPRTPSPRLLANDRRDLTPIAGSEATDDRSDDGNVLEETDNMLPEQRRDLERRRLSMEERRVAAAAAEYRKRLADRDAGATVPRAIGGVTRASTIQNKVKTLLDENQRPSPSKTAEGYGRYTDSAPSSQISQPRTFDAPPSARHVITRKPLLSGTSVTAPPSSRPGDVGYNRSRAQPVPQQQQQTILPSRTATRPSAPPKPTHLNAISTGPQVGMSGSPPKNFMPTGSGVGRRLEARPDMTAAEREDYIEDFSKRFPSLSGIELVETAIDSDPGNRGMGRGVKTKEV